MKKLILNILSRDDLKNIMAGSIESTADCGNCCPYIECTQGCAEWDASSESYKCSSCCMC